MGRTGVTYPFTITSVSSTPYVDEAWVDVNNVRSDDGTAASVTAASFDTGKYTHLLKCTNFNFAIPSDARIQGIICKINAWYANGTASLSFCKLYNASGTLVGNNRASSPVALTNLATNTITFGNIADSTNALGWNFPAGDLTPATFNDPNFGVAIAFQSTGTDADVFVDYVSIDIAYYDSFIDVTDSFDRPDNTTIGTDWTALPGAYGPSPQIYGNAAASVASETADWRCAAYTATSIGADQFTRATLAGAGSSYNYALVLRYKELSGFYFMNLGSSGTAELRRHVYNPGNGTYPSVALTPTGAGSPTVNIPSISSGTTELRIIGGTIQFYVGSVMYATYEENTLTEGAPGFGIRTNDGYVVQVSSWTGGPVVIESVVGSVTESCTLNDIVSVNKKFAGNTTENATAADTVSINVTKTPDTLLETLTCNDIVDAVNRTSHLAITETAVATDTVERKTNRAEVATPNEETIAEDTVDRGFFPFREFVEEVLCVDAIVGYRFHSPAEIVEEIAVLTDTIIGEVHKHPAAIIEVATAGDTVAQFRVSTSLSETISALDFVYYDRIAAPMYYSSIEDSYNNA